ncbi:MAG TPA: signal peptidase I [Clostridia bacterium]
MKTKTKKTTIKRILKAFSVIWYVLLMCVVFTLSFFLIRSKITNKVPFIGNYAILKVMTGSMETTIKKNQIVLVKKVSVEDIKESDVISYYHQIGDDDNKKEIVITHRVTEIITDPDTKEVKAFKTKGDANSTEDLWDVPKEKVIGVVDFGHPELVKILSFISNPLGIVVLVIFPLGIILISDFASLVKVINQKGDDYDDDFFDDDEIMLDDEDDDDGFDEFESFDFGTDNFYDEYDKFDDESLLDYYDDED